MRKVISIFIMLYASISFSEVDPRAENRLKDIESDVSIIVHNLKATMYRVRQINITMDKLQYEDGISEDTLNRARLIANKINSASYDTETLVGGILYTVDNAREEVKDR